MISTRRSRAEFWDGTLREIAMDLDVAVAIKLEDEQGRRWHTWHIAALSKSELPPFGAFVRPDEVEQKPAKRPVQSAEAQIAIFKSLRKKRG